MLPIVTAMLLSGVLVTYKDGVPIGREEYRDDGKALSAEFTLGPHKLKETIARAPRHVTLEIDGKKLERDVPDDTVVLENGSWQAYAIAAEWFKDAAVAKKVKLLVPSQGVSVDATIRVSAAPGGDKLVEVQAGPLTVRVFVDGKGQVRRAEVPLQHLEVTPETDKGRVSPSLGENRAPLAGAVEEKLEIERAGATLRGVLWVPAKTKPGDKPPLVVMIAGSGPTDRDGNSGLGLRSDCYRKLAGALAEHGIASLRVDKRGVGESTFGKASEADLVVGDLVDDAAAIVARAKKDARFSKVSVLGHSEGGLLALLLADKARPDALVLVATAGRPLSVVLREQLASKITADDLAAFDRMLPLVLEGKPLTASDVPEHLRPLFRPTVLPYLRSELSIDPVPLLAKSKLPVAVIQGGTDAQIGEEDAKKLAAARAGVTMQLVPKMNHVFAEEEQRTVAQASYNHPERALAAGFVEAVVNGVAR